MMIRGSEGYMEKNISNKVGIILTCTAGRFSQFSLCYQCVAVKQENWTYTLQIQEKFREIYMCL